MLLKKMALIPLNMMMMLIWFYGSRLLYWCMEGFVPIAFIIGSFVTVIGIWIVSNIFLIIRWRLPVIQSVMIIFMTILFMYVDPLLKPIYLKEINEHTMNLSFRILEYFKEWK